MQTHHLQTTLLMAGNLFFLLLFFFHSMAFMWPCCCWFCLVLVIAVLCTWLPAIQRPKLESLNDGAGLEMTLMIIHIASLKRQLFHYFPRLLGKGQPLIRSCAGGRIPAVSHRSQTHSACKMSSSQPRLCILAVWAGAALSEPPRAAWQTSWSAASEQLGSECQKVRVLSECCFCGLGHTLQPLACLVVVGCFLKSIIVWQWSCWHNRTAEGILRCSFFFCPVVYFHFSAYCQVPPIACAFLQKLSC